MSRYCAYYTALTHKHMIWLIVAHIKSNDNVVFHRTMDGGNNTLEFFVPIEQEAQLVEWLNLYESEGFIFSYQKGINRIMTDDQAAHVENAIDQTLLS